jgi:hypothetical protein
MRILLSAALLFAAAVVDRVAVVVGNTVITESEVVQELRLTDFMNSQPLDVSAAARRSAADRLVDQELLRQEMKAGNFAEPPAEDVQKTYQQFRRDHYPNDADFRAALERYGITEDELKQHLAWQLALIRFTDLRFQTGVAPPSDGSANREESIEQQMDAWLKDARSQTRVQFKQEAFQ